MNEATIPNVALTLRVLLVGGFLFILPRITRKGLLFGAYIGEASADREAARRVLRGWDRGCLIVMGLSLALGWGISVAGWPVTGNLTGTAFLLLGALLLYLRVHSRAQGMAPMSATRQAKKAVAPLHGGEPQGAGFAKVAIGICLLASLPTYAYAMVSHDAVPDKPFITVIFVPSLNLLLCPFIALIALLTAKAKRSIRGGSGGRSFEAQDALRATMANALSWAALLACASMTFLSVQIIRIRLSEIDSLGVGIWWLGGFVLLFLFGNLVRIVKRYGQGGAFLETGSAEAPLTNGLADNAHWVWGIFYVDRDDPSIMVEKRFGIGYTLNYGNWTAILIVVSFLGLSLMLATICTVGTF